MDGYINGWMDERIEDPKKALLIKAFLEDESCFPRLNTVSVL